MVRYMPCRYVPRQIIAVSKFVYYSSIVQATRAAEVEVPVDVTTLADALV